MVIESIQRHVAVAASGEVRGEVNPDEVEVYFHESKQEDYLIKELVLQVFLKKTEERVKNFQERHDSFFLSLKNNLPESLKDFSLQTGLSEHEYSESE